MLNGCVQFDDVEVKPSKSINSNFAVFCVLSPINDSNFVSINYLNKIGDIVNNKSINSEIEKVVITNLRNGKLATLQIKKQSFGVFYTTKNVLPIVENNTYRLEVKLKNGKIISSTTTIPSNNSLNIVFFPAVPYFDLSFQNYVYTLTGSWNSKSDSLSFRAYVKDNSSVNKNNTYLIGGSDLSKIGSIYNFKFQGYFNYKYVNATTSGFVDSDLDIYVLTLDPNFKKFSDSFDIYLNIDDYILNGFGFASLSGFKGIIPKFSNIENGFGVFGSCNFSDKYNVKIKYPK
jgi:hypothetical protein